MRCEVCQGNRSVRGFGTIFVSCPNCNGTGIQHCCEGLCEQPDEHDAADNRDSDLYRGSR